MTGWLADAALAHLRDVAEWPPLGERYEVVRRLGRGGMGTVFAARDHTLDREVAVKVLHDLQPVAGAAERLLSEARVLGRLEHPGIVPVHDAGALEDGRVFYVMKLVRGERLDEVAATRTLAQRLELFLRICDAVAFAHAHGVVHRDLKPQNIMLGPFGEVLVMDWGVAGALGAAEPAVVGTPGYMAPEQSRAGATVDGRVDVYALGVMLEAMLPHPSPRPLRAIASRARAAEVDDRYRDVSALARDVAAFREGAPVTAYRESPVERLLRVYQRHKLPITLVLAYMVIRVILLLWFRT